MIGSLSGKIKLLLGPALLLLLAFLVPGAAWAAGSPDTGNSSVSAINPASPLVGEEFTFTVVVRDAADNTVTGLGSSDFAVSGGSGTTTVTGAVYNAGAGDYTVTASHDTAETVTMAVYASGVHIGDIAHVTVTPAEFAGGDGSAGTPYQIANADQLNNVRNHLDAHFIMVADIDLTDTVWGKVYAQTNGTAGWTPIGWNTEGSYSGLFTGTFDGGDHTITGLYINLPDTWGVGLFAFANNEEISNVKLAKVDVTGKSSVGSLMGGSELMNLRNTIINSHLLSGTVSATEGTVGGLVGCYSGGLLSDGILTDCSAAGSVHSAVGTEGVGGLVGKSSGNITNSYASVDINSENLSISNVGGLVGTTDWGGIDNSYATGSVYGNNNVGGLVGHISQANTVSNSRATGSVSGKSNVGGLVGKNSGTIEKSYATGSVAGCSGSYYIGGLVGYNEDIIEYSYSTGNVSGNDYVGGLAGYGLSLDHGTGIANSYATGPVTGTYSVGGLVGHEHYGSIAKSYATGTVTGPDSVGGLVGGLFNGTIIDSFYNSQTTGQSDTGKGTPKTTTEMVQQSTFNNWNFTDTWNIDEWYSYPNLQWDNSPAPLPPSVSSITVSPASVNKTYGDPDFTLTATVLPAEAVQSIDWDSSNPAVATVDDNANVSIVGAGSATITARPRGSQTAEPDQCTVAVSRKALTVSSFTVNNKQYDGNATAEVSSSTLNGIVGTDNVTLDAAAVFSDKNAGDGKTVSLTGGSTLNGMDVNNYILSLAGAPIATAGISKKELTVTGAAAQNKVYDGTTDAVISGAALNGVVEGDDVVLQNNTAGTFAKAAAGDGIDVGTSMTVSGADAGNYTLTQPALTADITPKELTVGGTFTVKNKTYDGTTHATINRDNLALEGIAGTDEVYLTPVAAFADAAVETGKTVSLTGDSSISGTDAGNYTLLLVDGPTDTATITKKALTVTAEDKSKAYGTADPEFTVGYSGFVAGEDESDLGGTLTFNRAPGENVGSYAITPSGLTSSNYDITFTAGTLTILSNNADLSDLTLSSGTPSPAFDPGTTNYTAGVGHSTSSITVTATADDDNATITVNDVAVTSGQTSDAISLNVGSNTINVMVTAEDGQTGKTYTITITRAGSHTDGGSSDGGNKETPADHASKFIDADTGGSVSFGNAIVEVPAGTLPAGATLRVEKLTEKDTEGLVPSGLQVKLGSDVYEITTTGSRDFGDNTVTIKIAYDPEKIADGEEPVIRYRDETTGEWVQVPTKYEQGEDGKWYAVIQVNHLTKFAVFSPGVEEATKEIAIPTQKVIVLTLENRTATVDGSPYTLDAAPFVKPGKNRTLVPMRFVSEALGARVNWNAGTKQVVIRETRNGEQVEIILTTGSGRARVNGMPTVLDAPAEIQPPGRTFIPLRFVSETLGAQVDWNAAMREIFITR